MIDFVENYYQNVVPVGKKLIIHNMLSSHITNADNQCASKIFSKQNQKFLRHIIEGRQRHITQTKNIMNLMMTKFNHMCRQ